MFKRKHDKHASHFINKMMEIAGYNARYEHLLQMRDYPWYSEYTWTEEEEAKFSDWFMNDKMWKARGKKTARTNLGWFLLMYGLRTIPSKSDS